MFKYLVISTLLLATPVMAAQEPSKAPEKPSCGKTIDDCQKLVEALQGRLQTSQKAIEAYKQLLTEANDRLVGTAAQKQ